MDELQETPNGVFLGRQISTYRYDPFVRHGAPETLFLLLGLFPLPVYIIILLTNKTLMMFILDNPDSPLDVISPLLGFWFLGGARVAWNSVARRHDHVSLYEHGFIFHLRGRTGFRTWHKVQAITHEASSASCDRFTIRCREKPDVILDEEIRDVRALGRAIQGAVCQWLGEQVFREISSRGEARFGPLILNRTGVQYEGQTLAWSEIESVDLIRWPRGQPVEEIVICQAGVTEPWNTVPVSEVPNEFVLIDIAKRFLSCESGSPREHPTSGR